MAGVTADVFAVGDVIRYDPQDDKYLLAQANSEANAAFVGVIESITSNDVTVVYSGEISLPDSLMSTIAGSTGAQIFYLSDTQKGKLTTTAPSNPASVIKPVIITTGTTDDTSPTLGTVDGIVVNGQSTRISGDSTVDLSDIQPVGSVIAFAGNTGDVPAGWDICDGGLLPISSYSDLHASLNSGSIYGFTQQITMTKTNGTIIPDNQLIGSYFFVSKAGLNSEFRCTFLSVAVTGNNLTAEVLVDPLLVNGTYHNSQLVLGDQGRIYLENGSQTSTFYSVSSAVNPKVRLKKPDMRARFLIGSSRGLTGQENSAFGSYTIGLLGGEERHSLQVNELPIHGHPISVSASLTGNVSVSHNLTTSVAGAHNHSLFNETNIDLDLGGPDSVVRTVGGSSSALPNAGSHSHSVTGTISVSTNNLTPNVTASIGNAGGNSPHNNVPQHVVVYWIIKTRKDSYAKLYKLGPSGGGVVVAKNTAKRWARSTPGAGCTIDAGYGAWGVSYASKGNYIFSHDLLFDLGTADQTKYIVEATVAKSGSGLTQMFVANSYNYGGLTFGVQVYDIIGATHSDNFQYLNIVVYGGGTAV
jgi:microcystin-dependent protein